MAIFKSPTYVKGSRARPNSQVEAAEFTATVVIPAGTALVATTDVLYFGKLGENVDLISVDITSDSLDSTGTTTGTFGVVPASTAKTYAAVSGVASFNCVLAATALNGAAGIVKNIQRFAGGGTGDVYAANPFPIQTVVSDLVMTIPVVGTQVTTADRKITVRCKYQYAYPGSYASGVTDPRYPFAGSVINSAPIGYDYGGNAP